MTNDKFKKAISEALCKEYSELIPEHNSNHVFSDSFNKKMDKLIKKQRKPYYKLINTAGKRVACFVVLVLIVSFTTVIKVGRINWMVGQVLKLVFMAISFLAVIFLGTVVPMLSRGFWYNGWSKVVTDFANQFPEQIGNFGIKLLPENLYTQLDVFSAAVQSYFLVFTYLMIIGLLLLYFSLKKKKTLGFVLTAVVISIGMGLCAIKTKLMWIMPMANSIVWLHYTKYFRKPIMPISFSVCYLVIFIAVLLVFCFAAIRKFNYDNVTEIAM